LFEEDLNMSVSQAVSVYRRNVGDIVKSNHLVEAKYDLSLIEQKLVLLALSKLDIKARTNNKVSLKVKDFCEMIGSSADRYTEIRDIIRNIRKKEIIITSYDSDSEIKEELIAGWINAAYYSNGIVDLSFSEVLMPYLTELKDRYTIYNIENVLHINSKHAIRIYEILKENEFKKSAYFEYSKLKEMVCGLDKFERYYDFKKRVLLPSQKEIMENSDVYFDFEEIKKARKVIGINFTIHKNQKIVEKRQNDEKSVEQLKYYGEKDMMAVINKYNKKSKEEILDELHNLMFQKYGDGLTSEDLRNYSKDTLKRVVFGIVDGTYLDVKKPKLYFKKVLENLEAEYTTVKE
jgi:plasmid replication initiation protein